jgi:geranylgeranyl diphosphate synthase type II
MRQIFSFISVFLNIFNTELIEMIHCFTLIHDDLPCMDNDDFRRGRPSNHKVYGEAMALLAGDALVACATDTLMIAEGAVPDSALLRAIRRLSWAAGPRGVIGGQAMEPLLSKTSTLSDLEKMFAGKTGALFAASLLLPLDLAGVDESTREGAVTARFARELGYAFQVADDLEDAEAPDSKEAEKPQSILYFLSSTEAATQTSARLSRSIDELRTLFGARASGLADIGAEVLKKLALRMKKNT